jgi:cytochrome c oxidase assembly factor CtaG
VTYAIAVLALALYAWGARSAARRRRWPRLRSIAFTLGVVSIPLAIEGPLDAAADARFAPHMLQHLILTDVSAPLILLGAPLLLALTALPTRDARRLVSLLHSRLMHVVTFPAFTWLLFVGALWTVHLSGLYEAALENESVHVLEHIVFLGTALLFWLPVIVVGPVPWTSGPLAYPLRMIYVFAAMPAESLLGFVIYSAGHVLYPHYATSGLADQQAAGEIMWIGAGLVMFVAFMACGVEWMRDGVRRDEREVQRERSTIVNLRECPP